MEELLKELKEMSALKDDASLEKARNHFRGSQD